MKKTFILIVLLIATLISRDAKADHCAGGELIYHWISDSTYKFTFKFYRDCSGIAAPFTVDLCLTNGCSSTAIAPVALRQIDSLPDGRPNGSQVYSGCAGYPSTCTQLTSNLPGYQEYWYSGIVVLPFRCSSWTFAVPVSARNASVNINGISAMFYVECKLNNIVAQGNSSPEFTVKPVPYVCINNPYTFNSGVQDADGDSLSYQLLQPQQAFCGLPPSPVSFTSAVYNLTDNPLPCANTFVLNPTNGQMSFTPSSTGTSTLTLKVNEYRNGLLIGSVMRDIQVRSLALCSPANPVVSLDSAGVTGALMVNGRLEQCAGKPMNFCFKAAATTTSSRLIIRDNANYVASGAQITYSGQYTNEVTGCFSWTPGAADTGVRSFAITVKDSTCGPPGIAISQTYLIPIYIHSATIGTNDTSVCQGQSVRLNAIGGNNFSWSVLPGGAPLSSLSCTSCPSPFATPGVTTKYVVTSDLVSFCNTNRDTIEVKVNTVPGIPVLSSNSPVCFDDTLKLSTTATADQYIWSGPGGFSSGSRDPVRTHAILSYSGTYTLVVRNGGCFSSPGSIQVVIVDSARTPVITGDSMLCYGETLVLTATSDPGTNYSWTGPNGFTAATRTIEINATSPVNSGAYKVIAGFPSSACVSAEVSREVVVNDEIRTDFTVSRDHLCQQDTITVFFNGTNRSTINYRYDFGYGTNIVSGSGTNPYVVRYTLEGQNSILLYSSENGCMDTMKKDIFVEESPSSAFHVQPDACIGDVIWLNSNENVDFDLAYNWNFNGAQVIDGSGKGPYNISYNTPGYKVISFATESSSCPSLITTDTVYVHPAPEADILPLSKDQICAGDAVMLHAVPGADYSFTWFSGSALIARGAATTGVVSEPGNVLLTVKDSYGCSSSDSVFITTKPCCEVYLPTAFTPNDDGKNDVFRLVTLGNPLVTELRVLNRWGQTIFTSGSKNVGWDGTFNGKKMDSDTYFYYLRYKCTNGKYYDVKGDVVLVR